MPFSTFAFRRLLLIFAAIALAAAGGWWFLIQRGPATPRPANLSALDPEVADLIRERANALDHWRSDTGRRARLGMVYEANELYSLAARCYTQVLDRHPQQAAIWYRLAICREREGDLEGAIAAMRSAIEHHEPFAAAHARLATWLLDVGDLELATRSIERAQELDPAAPEGHFAAARLYLKRGLARRAADLLRKLASGSNADYAHHLLASAYRALGNPEAAAAMAARAQKRRPSFPDPQIRELTELRVGKARLQIRAGALVLRGDCKTAVPMLEELRSRDPGDARALNMLAQCHLRLGAPDQALNVLSSALEANPDSFITHLNLSKVATVAGQQGKADSTETALVHADRALTLRPSSGEAHATRAAALAVLGRRNEALSSYLQAWELDARDPAPLLRAGSLLLEAARWDEARQAFTDALAVHRAHPGALFGRARAEMELGQLEAAEATLDQLGKLAGKNQGTQNQAAQALAAARARLTELRAPKGAG